MGFLQMKRGTWKPQASEKECGYNLVDVSIIGGRDTKFGDYPFMALLGYNRTNPTRGSPYSYNCGGAVINKYYVITAAHCMIRSDPDVVILGEHDLRKDPDSGAAKRTVIGIEEIRLHEGYSKTLIGGTGPNDIALIRVKEPIPFLI